MGVLSGFPESLKVKNRESDQYSLRKRPGRTAATAMRNTRTSGL